jgi:hypothetical protein
MPEALVSDARRRAAAGGLLDRALRPGQPVRGQPIQGLTGSPWGLAEQEPTRSYRVG